MNANNTNNQGQVNGNAPEKSNPKPLIDEVNKLDECLREMVLASGDLIVNYLYSVDPNSVSFPSNSNLNGQEVKKYPVQEDTTNLVRTLQTEWQMLDAVCDQMYYILNNSKTSLEEELNILNGTNQKANDESSSNNKNELHSDDREISKKLSKIQSLF